MATESEIKDIIAETIHELHADVANVQFKKPTTIQGWFYIAVVISSVIAFCWTAVVFLNKVAYHAEEPHHEGTHEIFEKLQAQHKTHATAEDLHKREAEFELLMIRKVEPIKEDLVSIKQSQAAFKHDVRDIKQDVRDVQQSINDLAKELKK